MALMIIIVIVPQRGRQNARGLRSLSKKKAYHCPNAFFFTIDAVLLVSRGRCENRGYFFEPFFRIFRAESHAIRAQVKIIKKKTAKFK